MDSARTGLVAQRKAETWTVQEGGPRSSCDVDGEVLYLPPSYHPGFVSQQPTQAGLCPLPSAFCP